MTSYEVKESTLEVQATYSGLAFDLLKPAGGELHDNVAARLSEFYVLTANDIRINRDVVPLANANVTYSLTALDGIARVSIDKLQIAFFSAHAITEEQASGASLAIINAVQDSLPSVRIGSYIVTVATRGAIEDVEPVDFLRQFVATRPENLGDIVGNSIGFNLGPEGPISYSDLRIEMSGRYSDSVFINVAIAFDGEMIQASELAEFARGHYYRLLQGIGLELE